MSTRAVLWVSLCVGCSSSTSPAEPTDAGVEAEAEVPKIKAPTGDPLTWPVDKAGPYNVGHRTFDVTYRPPGQSVDRTIPVDVFYPTLDADGEHPRYLKLFGDPDVYEEASVAPPPTSAGYPVHVYSHGSNGFGGTSSDMAHWFSSHGWVYVAPNHVGNVLGAGEGKRPVSLYYLRSTDVTAALDAVEKLAAPDPLAGKLRTKRVLMSGHSYGTFTTWASSGAQFDVKAIQAKCDKGEFTAPCKPEELAVFAKGVADPRIVAGIPMAGGTSDWFVADGYDRPEDSHAADDRQPRRERQADLRRGDDPRPHLDRLRGRLPPAVRARRVFGLRREERVGAHQHLGVRLRPALRARRRERAHHRDRHRHRVARSAHQGSSTRGRPPRPKGCDRCCRALLPFVAPASWARL